MADQPNPAPQPDPSTDTSAQPLKPPGINSTPDKTGQDPGRFGWSPGDVETSKTPKPFNPLLFKTNDKEAMLQAIDEQRSELIEMLANTPSSRQQEVQEAIRALDTLQSKYEDQKIMPPALAPFAGKNPVPPGSQENTGAAPQQDIVPSEASATENQLQKGVSQPRRPFDVREASARVRKRLGLKSET